jgi:hypothetical protein
MTIYDQKLFFWAMDSPMFSVPIIELAQIEIIDIKPKKRLLETWKEFFCSHHYDIRRSIWNSYLFYYPRRSCEALAMATLQNMPWKDNPFPRTTSLSRLQEWARLFWSEENEGRLSGKPSCSPIDI